MANYDFFQNKECEYFPCHAGADPENFNCLSAIVRCMRWGIGAEEASAIRTGELRIVPGV